MDFLDNIFGNLFGGINDFLSNIFGGGKPGLKTYKKNPATQGPRPTITAPRAGVARPKATPKGPVFTSLIDQGRAPC